MNKLATFVLFRQSRYTKKEKHMHEIYTKQRAVLFGVFLLITGALNNANAENSQFVHFKFGSDVSIWAYRGRTQLLNLLLFWGYVIRIACQENHE